MRSLMAVAFLVVVLVRTALAEPVPLWTVDFDSVGTVPQTTDSRSELASGGIGSGLVFSIPPGGYSTLTSIARIDGDGTPVWIGQHVSGASFYGTPPKARVLSDGSVIVIADAIHRYASNGELVWAAPLPSLSGEVVEVGSRLLLASSTSGSTAAVLDLASGRTLETLSDAGLGLDGDTGLAAVGSDTVYAFNAQGMRIHKLRLDPLRIEWSVSLYAVTSPREPVGHCCRNLIVADASGAYVSGQSVVAKISAVDGSLLWSQSTAPEYSLTLAADSSNPTDILAVGPNRVTSLARSTGVPRWTHVPASPLSGFKAFDNAVVVVGGSDLNGSGSTPGFMERLHRDSGAVLWQQPITGLPNATFSVDDVGVEGGRIAASGVQCASGQIPERCEWVIWHASIDGGAVAMVKPLFRQSVERARSDGNAESTFAAALVATPAGPRILVRHIRNSDGVVLWETSISAAFPNAPGRAIAELNVVLTRTASPDVVVAFSRRPDGAVRPQPVGDAVVAKLRGSDGALQWQRSLLNPSGGFTETAASAFTIRTDASGNVFASVQEIRPNLLSGLFDADRREIRKYASANGDEVFRVAFQPLHSGITGIFTPVPPDFRVVGDVAITSEPPLPRTDYGAFGFDPTTGGVLWSNTGPSYLSPLLLSEGSTAFSARMLNGLSGRLGFTRFDGNSGSIAWESTYADPTDAAYSQPFISRGSDNGIYVRTGSRLSTIPLSPQNPQTPRILRVDDASGAITWVNRFENGPVRPYAMPLPLFGHDGVLVTSQAGLRSSVSSGLFLTGLSEANGAFQGTTAVTFDSVRWPQLPSTRIDNPRLRSGNAMIVSRFGDLPGEPTRFSVRKWPLPQPFSGGSLRTGMTASASVIAGQRVSSFRFDVVNDGTVGADAVEAVVGLPSQAIIDSITCTFAGSPCVVEATPYYLRKLVNIGIGERLVVTATIRSSAAQAANPSIEASAFSTIGLVEMDMKDNVASANLLDVVFSNGFDQ